MLAGGTGLQQLSEIGMGVADNRGSKRGNEEEEITLHGVSSGLLKCFS